MVKKKNKNTNALFDVIFMPNNIVVIILYKKGKF